MNWKSRKHSSFVGISHLDSGEYLSLRVCVGTWNVGGKLPPDDLDIDDWVSINEPADIYVLG